MIRELTQDEESRLLTQKEVDVLPSNTSIMVKWDGGNGPHLYEVARGGWGYCYAKTPGEKRFQVSCRRLFPVGKERCHVRVFLPLNPEMCMDIAPGHIASTVTPDPITGLLKAPWCHLLKGHCGPHVCGEFRWEEKDEK